MLIDEALHVLCNGRFRFIGQAEFGDAFACAGRRQELVSGGRKKTVQNGFRNHVFSQLHSPGVGYQSSTFTHQRDGKCGGRPAQNCFLSLTALMTQGFPAIGTHRATLSGELGFDLAGQGQINVVTA